MLWVQCFLTPTYKGRSTHAKQETPVTVHGVHTKQESPATVHKVHKITSCLKGANSSGINCVNNGSATTTPKNGLNMQPGSSPRFLRCARTYIRPSATPPFVASLHAALDPSECKVWINQPQCTACVCVLLLMCALYCTCMHNATPGPQQTAAAQ